MGCGCSKKNAATSWSYEDANGAVVAKNLTEVQAKAMAIRNGGGQAKPA